MFCSNCGKELGNGNFCSFCGAKIIKSEVIEKNEKTESSFFVEKEADLDPAPTTTNFSENKNKDNYLQNDEVSTKSENKKSIFRQFETLKLMLSNSNNKKIVLFVALTIIAIVILTTVFSNRSNITKLSNGTLAYKVTMFEYMEQYNKYLYTEAQNDFPGKSENYYTEYIASRVISLENAKKQDEGNGTTLYKWDDLFDSVTHGILVDNDTNYVISASVVMRKERTDDAKSDDIEKAFMPLNENYRSFMKKALKVGKNYAFKDNQVLSYTDYNGNVDCLMLQAITKKDLKDLLNGKNNERTTTDGKQSEKYVSENKQGEKETTSQPQTTEIKPELISEELTKTEIDFFSLIEDRVVFEGADGYGRVYLNVEENDEFQSGDVYFVYTDRMSERYRFDVIKDNALIAETALEFSGENYSSGDKVKCSFSYNTRAMEEGGVKLLETSHIYTVPKLADNYINSASELSTKDIDLIKDTIIKYIKDTHHGSIYESLNNKNDIKLYFGTIKGSAVNHNNSKHYVLAVIEFEPYLELIACTDIYRAQNGEVRFDIKSIGPELNKDFSPEKSEDSRNHQNEEWLKDYTFEKVDR